VEVSISAVVVALQKEIHDLLEEEVIRVWI